MGWHEAQFGFRRHSMAIGVPQFRLGGWERVLTQ